MTWLRDKSSLHQVGDWVEITTSWLDWHNDYLQIYARPENGGYVLTDDGFILANLLQSGCPLDSPKRHGLLRSRPNGFGVRLEDDAFQVHASSETFPIRKRNLVQAMLAVNDLFYLASPMVATFF